MTTTISTISDYQQFVDVYGSEAAREARQAGFIDDRNDLADGKAWKDVASWAQSKGFHPPDLPRPKGGNAGQLESSMRSFENISILFHSVLKQIRTAQREESYAAQHRVVETMQHAADKRVEAADKLQTMAGISMALAFGGFAAGVAMGALSGVFQAVLSGITSAIKAAVKAVSKAIDKMLSEIMKGITKLVKEAVDKIIQAAVKASGAAGKEGAKEATKAVNEAVQKSAKELGAKVTELVKNELMKVVRELTKGMPKMVQKTAEKLVNKVSKAVGRFVEKTFAKVMKQAVKQLGKGVEPLANTNELSATLTKEVMDQVSKGLKNVMDQSLKKAASPNLLQSVFKGSMQALGNPVAASQMGTQAASGATQFSQTTGQAESQRYQAEGDKISAQAEFVRGEKQRLDDYTAGINDTMRTIRQKLAEINEAQVKAMQAAAKI
jgi:hypothetical protein